MSFRSWPVRFENASVIQLRAKVPLRKTPWLLSLSCLLKATCKMLGLGSRYGIGVGGRASLRGSHAWIASLVLGTVGVKWLVPLCSKSSCEREGKKR